MQEKQPIYSLCILFWMNFLLETINDQSREKPFAVAIYRQSIQRNPNKSPSEVRTRLSWRVTCHFVLRHFNRCNFNRCNFNRLHFQPFSLSTAGLFDRLQIQPLANSTATNSTYLIKFKVIQFFQDVRKQVK